MDDRAAHRHAYGMFFVTGTDEVAIRAVFGPGPDYRRMKAAAVTSLHERLSHRAPRDQVPPRSDPE